MKTINTYIPIDNGRAVQGKRQVSTDAAVAQITRYFTCYRLAYGRWPEADSINVELREYHGAFSLEEAMRMLADCKQEYLP